MRRAPENINEKKLCLTGYLDEEKNLRKGFLLWAASSRRSEKESWERGNLSSSSSRDIQSQYDSLSPAEKDEIAFDFPAFANAAESRRNREQHMGLEEKRLEQGERHFQVKTKLIRQPRMSLTMEKFDYKKDRDKIKDDLDATVEAAKGNRQKQEDIRKSYEANKDYIQGVIGARQNAAENQEFRLRQDDTANRYRKANGQPPSRCP